MVSFFEYDGLYYPEQQVTGEVDIVFGEQINRVMKDKSAIEVLKVIRYLKNEGFHKLIWPKALQRCQEKNLGMLEATLPPNSKLIQARNSEVFS